VYKSRLPTDLCDSIVNEYKDSDFSIAQIIRNGGVNQVKYDDRNCKVTLLLNNTTPYRQYLDNQVYKSMFEATKQYSTEYSQLLLRNDSGYELMKYEIGGMFKPHYDQFAGGEDSYDSSTRRVVSCVALINSEFEGGELRFFEGKYKYTPKLEKGDIIMFPSNFLFPHEVTEVTKGTRYSIVTWFT
jgi:predicted 2-oxoglutarate/Fe(II)-dependent dioxygenase YbiX